MSWMRRLLPWLFALNCLNTACKTQPPPKEVRAPAPAPSAAAPPAACSIGCPADSEEFYGVYVNDTKVGWMRTAFQTAADIRAITELHATVQGMGRPADIDLTETRTYEGHDGALQAIHFVQSAATGKVEVSGQGQGAQMDLQVDAGGSSHHQVLQVAEHLQDALATYHLARQAKRGATVTVSHLDPSIQKLVKVEHRIDAVEPRTIAGVTVSAVKVVSTYPELGVSETAWMDDTGKILESRIGGFFVARLEPPEVAKKLDYHQDLLVSSVVRVPHALANSYGLERLQLTFTGFGDHLPPASARQQVKQSADRVSLILRKDPKPPAVPLSDAAKGPRSPEVEEALQPTPFIQSDAPELQQAARKAVGDAQDVFVASTRLVDFVYHYIHSEYVPAFSNALEALHSARGDCTEHSILFVALARAVGIPARMAVGIAYWPAGDGFGWHAWAEIYVAGRWVAVDPTWNQPVADATHVKLADGGPAEQARIVMLLGQLKIKDMKAG